MIATIVIPILLLIFNIAVDISIVPLFIILYVFFRYLNHNAHKLYLKHEKEEERKKSKTKVNKVKVIKYIFILIISGVLLYIDSELLGNTLERLCVFFNVSQIIIGILLGFITSIPELITFFEAQKHHKNKKEDILGVVEATNNLLTSNMINLFIIQTIGIIIINI